jgi:outer membrane protein assembly factor BamA
MLHSLAHPAILSEAQELTLQQQTVYEGQKVAVVDLISKPATDVEALRPMVVQKAGEPYSEEKVKDTVTALKKSGRFTAVDVLVKPETAGLRVVFVMEPAFYIGLISFPGASRTFNYSQLLQVVDDPAEEPYEENRVTAAVPALEGYFATHGYFMAKVYSETNFDETHKVANVIFHVNLNKHAKLGKIAVSGPPPGQAVRLERVLGSFFARLKGASLKTGKPYDPERIQAAARYLRDYLGKGNYLASRVRLERPHYEPETNRADLAFQVTLGPLVSIRVEGAHIFRRTLRKLIPMYQESEFDRDLVDEGHRNLVSYFQSKGYFDAKVSQEVHEEARSQSVVYRIEKGNKHRVRSVRIAHDGHFKDKDLTGQVVIEKARFLSRGKFSQDLLNKSTDNLKAFYQNAGFADVKVEPEVVDRERQVYGTFHITEGPQTLVSSFRMEGNKTQPLAKLAPHGLHLRAGQPYSSSLLNLDRNAIVATYLNLGYMNVGFKSTVKPLEEDSHRVTVTYLIEEGPEAHISGVAYLGGPHTRRSFLERNTTVRAGGPVSEGQLLESEGKLYNFGVFDWAEVTPRRPITDQTQEEVLVKVHEAKRNSFSYGLGFQSTSRQGGLSSGIIALPGLPTIGLPKSFTTKEPFILSPMGSVEYSRLNLLGRAEAASVSTLLSRLDQKLSFTYTDPQFPAMNWSAVGSFSAERSTMNPLFTARLGSASFDLEKTLNAAKTMRLQFRYTYQRTTLTNLLIQNFVAPDDTNIKISRLSTSLVHDTRDKPLDAHKGVFQTLDFGITPTAIGSSDNLVRFFGQTAFYHQIKPWMIWANNFRLGMVKSFDGSHVPLSERFFSGGADSLRGFPLNGAGPQQIAELCTAANNPADCTARITVPTGGRELAIWNTEGRFPIPGANDLGISLLNNLGGVIFYDGGDVYNNISFKGFIRDYSNTVGFGLRIQTPVGPVRFDIGRNLNPVPGLNATQYFITLGQSF